MSGNELAKRPASVIRSYTQEARDLAAALAREHDKYLAKLARAQVEYKANVKRVIDAFEMGETPDTDAPQQESAPQQAQ